MTSTGCETFDKWCALHDVQPMQAAPATVARFVTDIAAMGVEKIWPMIGEISRAHYLIGLADPTLGGAVSAALNDIARIEPPRSWPKEHKFQFGRLPYDLQIYVASHESQRETEVRRAHNEAAMARRELAEIQKPKEKINGTQSTVAA